MVLDSPAWFLGLAARTRTKKGPRSVERGPSDRTIPFPYFAARLIVFAGAAQAFTFSSVAVLTCSLPDLEALTLT